MTGSGVDVYEHIKAKGMFVVTERTGEVYLHWIFKKKDFITFYFEFFRGRIHIGHCSAHSQRLRFVRAP